MDSWKIELKDFNGKNISHPFLSHLLDKEFSNISHAKKEALQAIKQYPPFVRATLRSEQGQSVSLIDERWHFRPLVLDPELSAYFIRHMDIVYFLEHLREKKRTSKLPNMAVNDPIKFWSEYLVGARAYVDYRRKKDPSPLKTYKLYVLKEISHNKNRLWEAVFDLDYTLHRTNSLYTDVFDYRFNLRFKTFYDLDRSKTLKNVKNKEIQHLNLRFQWHVRFLAEQLEEIKLAAFEDEICNYAWENASSEDKHIANVLVPISDLSMRLEKEVSEPLQWLANAASRLIGYFHHVNNDKEIFNAGGRWLTEKEKKFWVSLNDEEQKILTNFAEATNKNMSEEILLKICNIYSKSIQLLRIP